VFDGVAVVVSNFVGDFVDSGSIHIKSVVVSGSLLVELYSLDGNGVVVNGKDVVVPSVSSIISGFLVEELYTLEGKGVILFIV
jgi:hypothetical protein